LLVLAFNRRHRLRVRYFLPRAAATAVVAVAVATAPTIVETTLLAAKARSLAGSALAPG